MSCVRSVVLILARYRVFDRVATIIRVVGPADRVAKSPYMKTEIDVKDWIERQCKGAQ